MPSTTPSTSSTATRIARVPYLNSAPFFADAALEPPLTAVDLVPRRLAERARAGEVLAGPLPVVEFFRMEEAFERLGHFGIAVRGRARSALLFSRVPIRQLDGARIAVTEESSTTALLLRLLLEQRYHLQPARYERGEVDGAEARLVIGDEALRLARRNTQFPYEIDVAFEWWLWQHLPFVFAVWAIRRDAEAEIKKSVELSLARALSRNTARLGELAAQAGGSLGVAAEELEVYLRGFIYRLGHAEEEGMARFRALLHESHLL